MTWVAALTTGAGAGLLSFGTLWFSLRYWLFSPRGQLLFRMCSAARLGFICLMLYGLSREGLDKMLAGMTGVWLARWCLVRQLGGITYGR